VEIIERLEVGENDYGYRFAVGSIPDEGGGVRWIGFADSDVGAFVFPAICEGHMMGIKDRDRAIKLTGAIAQSSEHGYGGVKRWFVEEALRGKPEDFTCSECGAINCSGDCCDSYEDY
jgi:hypothetical protein